MSQAYVSRNPRPGYVLCTDPTCMPAFGHPHYHEPSAGTAEPDDWATAKARELVAEWEMRRAHHHFDWLHEIVVPDIAAALREVHDAAAGGAMPAEGGAP